MELINKKNFIPILGVSYTVISLAVMVIETVTYRKLDAKHYNFIALFLFCLIGMTILSQHKRLDRFSMPAVILIQYLAGLGFVILYTWLTGLWEPLHPDGYRDMAVSFTALYLIGAAIYYINLKRMVSKQNQDIQLIRKLHEARMRTSEKTKE